MMESRDHMLRILRLQRISTPWHLILRPGGYSNGFNSLMDDPSDALFLFLNVRVSDAGGAIMLYDRVPIVPFAR